MGRRGRKRQFGIEDEYWQLILGGIAPSRPASESASAGRPATGGELNEAASRRRESPKRSEAGAICPSSSGNASRRSVARALG